MVYENILIGDFIFELGYNSALLGMKGNKVDLTQQTPNDILVGDLLGRVGGRNFIVEFKRNRAGLQKEKQKPSRLLLLNSHIDEHNLLLSSTCHFVAFGEAENIMFNPYLDLRIKGEISNSITQDSFFKSLIEQSIGVNEKELKDYISFLTEKNATASGAALIVNVKADRKPIIIDMSGDIGLNKQRAVSQKMNIAQGKGKTKGMSR